jgi:hypothetical protein
LSKAFDPSELVRCGCWQFLRNLIILFRSPILGRPPSTADYAEHKSRDVEGCACHSLSRFFLSRRPEKHPLLPNLARELVDRKNHAMFKLDFSVFLPNPFIHLKASGLKLQAQAPSSSALKISSLKSHGNLLILQRCPTATALLVLTWIIEPQRLMQECAQYAVIHRQAMLSFKSLNVLVLASLHFS